MSKTVLLLTPGWGHPWIDICTKLYAKKGYKVEVRELDAPELNPDIVLHMWASGDTHPELYPDAVNIMYLRRYELVACPWPVIRWDCVDKLIFVNDFIRAAVLASFANMEGITTPDTELIYNAVDGNIFTYGERKPGNKIGMVCHLHPKKNIMMAVQILGKLPEDYELHVLGNMDDIYMLEYLRHMARQLNRKIVFYEKMPLEAVNEWWEDKNFCLSSSMAEGNPNCVLEAMSKGIKPIVHHWMGAKAQFSPWIFNTVEEAVDLILADDYNSADYRAVIDERFSIDNYQKVVDMTIALKEDKGA